MTDSVGRSSLIGVAISLVGNVLISLALNCQKLAHVRLEKEEGEEDEEEEEQQQQQQQQARNERGVPDEENQSLLASRQSAQSSRAYGTTAPDRVAKSDGRSLSEEDQGDDNIEQAESMSTTFLRSRLWWLGICLMTLGEFGNFLSYGFAPASLVAPLGAVALLANVIISPILLKERFYPSDIGGILLAIVGAVTVVFSSKQSDASLNPDQLWEAICRKEFIAYAIIVVILAALLAWASTTTLGQRWILLDLGVCALLGGFTVLSTKGLSSLLSQGNWFDLLRYPITYGLVVILVGTALAQITYLNRALQRFDSKEVIPTQFVVFTISAIVGSAILYQDFANMDAHRLINFLFGCLTTFAGVFTLTRHKEDDIGGIQSNTCDSQQVEDPQRVPQQGQEHVAIPVAVPKTARPVLMGGKASRGSRPLTTGSVPTILNPQGGSVPGLVTLTPANSSLNSTGGSVPKYIVTRRSIFNPAFPVAFIEANSNRRL